MGELLPNGPEKCVQLSCGLKKSEWLWMCVVVEKHVSDGILVLTLGCSVVA